MKKNLLFIKALAIAGLCIPVTSGAQNILGVDVSSYYGNSINWQQVKTAGKVFAWSRAMDGMGPADPSFTINMVNGHNAGVVMGAYYFAEPDSNTGAAEANYFLSVASPYIKPGYLPPALDLELGLSSYSSAALTAWVQEWMTTVQNATGIAPVIYTARAFTTYLDSSLNTYGLWLADYDGTTMAPADSVLGVWTTWVFKQYTDTGVVSGINATVDLSVFNGDTTAFNNLVGRAATEIGTIAAQPEIDLYPDPVSAQMTLSIHNNVSENTYIEILDVCGQVVGHSRNIEPESGFKYAINTGALAPGTYWLRVTDQEGTFAVKRFVKM